MSAILTTAALAILAYAVPSQEHDNRPTELDRFNLYTKCQRVQVLFEVEGVEEDRVRATVESRLRAARLYEPPSGQSEHGAYLVVTVVLVDPISIINTELFKRLFDPITRTEKIVATWSSPRHAPNNKRPKDALAALAESMDAFISDYLRVNESACKP